MAFEQKARTAAKGATAPLCVLCGGSAARVVLSEGEYSILECVSCRLAVTIPEAYVSSADYDDAPELASGYALQESKFREYARRMLSSVQRFTSSGRLLDVGCSVGLLVDEARLSGFEAEGIDLDSNAIRHGQEQGRAVYEASLEGWTSSDYDVICLSHSLGHIPRPLPFLSACISHLKEGGYLAVVVPCYRGLHPRLYGGKWYGWLPSQHYFHYSSRALTRLFQKAGLASVAMWQESMDHRPLWKHIRRRDIPRAFTAYAVAAIGGALGRGDQLVGIARRQGHG